MSRNREGRSTPTSTTQLEPSRTRLTGTLRLRGEPLPTRSDSTEREPAPTRRIRWAEDVVDNEGLGRKSSKGKFFRHPHQISYYVVDKEHFITNHDSPVCCIFHKSRPAGESSSESDSEPSSSSDESDSDIDIGEARARNRRPPQQRRRREECQHEPEHEHGDDHTHPHDDDDNDDDPDDNGDESDKKNPSQRKRKHKPNAYERMPHYGKKKPDGGKDTS